SRSWASRSARAARSSRSSSPPDPTACDAGLGCDGLPQTGQGSPSTSVPASAAARAARQAANAASWSALALARSAGARSRPARTLELCPAGLGRGGFRGQGLDPRRELARRGLFLGEATRLRLARGARLAEARPCLGLASTQFGERVLLLRDHGEPAPLLAPGFGLRRLGQQPLPGGMAFLVGPARGGEARLAPLRIGGRGRDPRPAVDQPLVAGSRGGGPAAGLEPLAEGLRPAGVGQQRIERDRRRPVLLEARG